MLCWHGYKVLDWREFTSLPLRETSHLTMKVWTFSKESMCPSLWKPCTFFPGRLKGWHREWNWEGFNWSVLHFKIMFIFNVHLDLVRPQLVLEEDKMHTDSLSQAVREVTRCVWAPLQRGPQTAALPLYSLSVSDRRGCSCRKSWVFQEISISGSSARKHFASWGWGHICDHWDFLKAISSPAACIRGHQ